MKDGGAVRDERVRRQSGAGFQKESSEGSRCQQKCLIIRQGRPEEVDGLGGEAWDDGREPGVEGISGQRQEEGAQEMPEAHFVT